MKTLKIATEIEFLSPLLGSQCSNPKVHSDFIASKAPTERKADEETRMIEESLEYVDPEEEGITIFMRDADGNPVLPMHHITGFLKETIGGLRDNKKSCSAKVTSYKKKISREVHVHPDYILINTDEPIDHFERPQRVEGPQGEKSALANSERIAGGATCSFEIILDNPDLKDAVLECLGYGMERGLGQWRNGGFGKFKVTKIDLIEEETDYRNNLPL